MTLKGLNEAVEKARAIYPFEDDKTEIGFVHDPRYVYGNESTVRLETTGKTGIGIQITVPVNREGEACYT